VRYPRAARGQAVSLKSPFDPGLEKRSRTGLKTRIPRPCCGDLFLCHERSHLRPHHFTEAFHAITVIFLFPAFSETAFFCRFECFVVYGRSRAVKNRISRWRSLERIPFCSDLRRTPSSIFWSSFQGMQLTHSAEFFSSKVPIVHQERMSLRSSASSPRLLFVFLSLRMPEYWVLDGTASEWRASFLFLVTLKGLHSSHFP